MKKYISLIVVILVIGLVALFNSVSNSMKGEEKPMDTGHSHEHGPKLLDATLVFRNVIVLETTGGNIEIAVLRKDIPNASKRMLSLAKKDQFKDIPVVKATDWLVQFDELPIELEPLHYETANNLLSGNYAVGLAHRKSPDSGTSSIFIIREPSFSVLESYTIFGYVVKGQDVVDGRRQHHQKLRAREDLRGCGSPGSGLQAGKGGLRSVYAVPDEGGRYERNGNDEKDERKSPRRS